MPPPDYCGPTTPDFPFESSGLGYSEFARHYYRNHFCFLFLWVLRWFTSPGSLLDPMYSDQDNPRVHGLDFSIRKSPDHRLLASPRSLSQLATSFIASLRQGILTHALSSLTIKFTPNTIFKTFFIRSAKRDSLRRFRKRLVKGRMPGRLSSLCAPMQPMASQPLLPAILPPGFAASLIGSATL